MSYLSYCLSFVLLFVSFSSFCSSRDNVNCGIVPGQPLTNPYGPYDAINPAHADKLPIVLGAHFTSDVERLIRGNRGPLLADIDYTLRAIPNYHRALASVARYHRQVNIAAEDRDMYYTPDCYFKRAIYFTPKDVTARMLFAMHLHLTGRLNDSYNQYQQAIAIAPDYAELNYNLGLLLVDLKNYDEALESAKKAYAAGYPLQGLKNKLLNAGYKLSY